MSQNEVGGVIDHKYRILRRLGGGSFGEIYLCQTADGTRYAAKFESHTSRCPQLRHEYKVYRELSGLSGFSKIVFYGQHNDFNVLIIELLGASLEDLFIQCDNRFSIRTVLKIADQLLTLIDGMHNRHLVHRDIKPANFLLGTNDNSKQIFCIDFGLSKRFRFPDTLEHIPYREGKSLTGTPRYASITNHLGVEQSRRDDLESIGYVLIYFLKGILPWQGLQAHNIQKKYQLICDKKQSTSITELCQGLPSEFAWFLRYSRELAFNQAPNIELVKQTFSNLYTSLGFYPDDPFDWEIKLSRGVAKWPNLIIKDKPEKKVHVIVDETLEQPELNRRRQRSTEMRSRTPSHANNKAQQRSLSRGPSRTPQHQISIFKSTTAQSPGSKARSPTLQLTESNEGNGTPRNKVNQSNQRLQLHSGAIGAIASNLRYFHSPRTNDTSNNKVQEARYISKNYSSGHFSRSSSVSQAKIMGNQTATSSTKPLYASRITSQPPPLIRNRNQNVQENQNGVLDSNIIKNEGVNRSRNVSRVTSPLSSTSQPRQEPRLRTSFSIGRR